MNFRRQKQFGPAPSINDTRARNLENIRKMRKSQERREIAGGCLIVLGLFLLLLLMYAIIIGMVAVGLKWAF